MLHQQRHLEQLVHLLVHAHVLHGLGYFLGGFGREPVVGLPGVCCSDLESGLLAYFLQVPAQELLQHPLALEFMLGVEPQYFGDSVDFSLLLAAKIPPEVHNLLEAALDFKFSLHQNPLDLDIFGGGYSDMPLVLSQPALQVVHRLVQLVYVPSHEEHVDQQCRDYGTCEYAALRAFLPELIRGFCPCVVVRGELDLVLLVMLVLLVLLGVSFVFGGPCAHQILLIIRSYRLSCEFELGARGGC